MTILSPDTTSAAEAAGSFPAAASPASILRGDVARREGPRRSHAGRWCLVASLVLHGILVGALWRFAVPRPPRPTLEFSVEMAGMAEDVAPPEVEVTAEPEPEIPPPEPVAAETAPTDDPVPEELPELEAQPEAPSPDWSASVPSVTARVRPPAPPTPEPAPSAPPVAAAPPPPAATPPRTASAGAARVERASPFATNRRPAYPTESRRRGEQGTVVLRLTLAADGTVTEVAVEASSGHPRLDEAAVAAAWGWRFQPATTDGVPMPSVARQRVAFRLDAP